MILIYLIKIIIIRTGNKNNISALSLQVRIVLACGATLRKPELCGAFIAILGLQKYISEP